MTESERQSSDWDVRNAPRNYAALVLTQIASAVFSFAAVWLVTRYLGSDGYGGIVAIIAASQVAQVFVNWTSMSVVRFGVDEFIETEKIARTFWVRLSILAVNLLVVLLIAALWFPPLAGWLKLSPETFWLVGAHFAVTAVWIHVQMSLQGVKMLRAQGLLLMMERVFIALWLAGLASVASMTPTAAMLCYIMAPLAMIVVGIFQIRRFVFARFAVDRALLKKILKYSLPLLPFSLIGYFSGSYVDAVFVSHFLSTRDLGVYAVASQIGGIVLQFPALAHNMMLPMFVTFQKESKTEWAANFFRKLVPTLNILWGIGCAVLAVAAFYLIPIVFGVEFSDAARPAWILLAASAVALPVAFGFSPLAHSMSATYISMWSAIFGASANVTANVLLIPRYGLVGCAWATLISYLVSSLTFTILLRKESAVSPLRIMLSCLPAVAGAALLTVWEMPLAAIAAVVVAAGIFLLAFRADTVAGINLARRLVRPV